jgi:hypothetical protein
MNSQSSSEPYGDYTATATPVAWLKTGDKNFCTTEDGVIKKQLAANGSLTAAEVHSNCIDGSQYVPLGN